MDEHQLRSVGRPQTPRTSLAAVAGVFAGTARGARIGALIGAGGCFVFLMGYTIIDAIRVAPRGTTLGEIAAGLLIGSVWFGFVSLGLGAIPGAALGAIVGALFPVRRSAAGEGAEVAEGTRPDPSS